MQIHTIEGGGGLKLHVREWGNPTGPAILFIHGWSQSHMCWQWQYESPLASTFRLVALDNRGHGMSEKPLDLESYADSKLWADDIDAIMTTLALAGPVLVGWSYGGLIIGDYMRSYGQTNIAGINYTGAASVLNESAFGTLIGPGFLENFEAATSPDLPTNIEAMKKFLHDCFEVPPAASDFETALAYNMCVPSAVRLNLGSRDLDNTDVLRKLQVPVLVSHGRQDCVVLPASAELIAQHYPSSEVSWFDNVGHAPFIEDPVRFNRELSTFVERCQG